MQINKPSQPRSISSIVQTTDSRDVIMLQYLKSVRDFMETQRDVMVSYFGELPTNKPARNVNITHQDELTITAKPVKSVSEKEPEFSPAVLSVENFKNSLLDIVSK